MRRNFMPGAPGGEQLAELAGVEGVQSARDAEHDTAGALVGGGDGRLEHVRQVATGHGGGEAAGGGLLTLDHATAVGALPAGVAASVAAPGVGLGGEGATTTTGTESIVMHNETS